MTLNPDQDLDQQKAALRKAQSLIRKEASIHANQTASSMADRADEIITRLALGAQDIVAGYWPIKTEIDPRPLMARLSERGIVTALPATPQPGMPLVFHQWKEGDVMVDGLYGTSEPSSDAPICYPTVLLVPLLAFDDDFYRLGYGGGFYDRSLAALRARGGRIMAVGIAYDAQQTNHVPIGPYDARLEGVLTETGLKMPEA